MQLAYYDRTAPSITRTLPRKPGEDRTTYTLRFFAELRRMGNVNLCTVRGNRRRTIAKRAL